MVAASATAPALSNSATEEAPGSSAPSTATSTVPTPSSAVAPQSRPAARPSSSTPVQTSSAASLSPAQDRLSPDALPGQGVANVLVAAAAGARGKDGRSKTRPPPDGRVRTAIPNRLRAMDSKKGNFAVMQMNLHKPAMLERHAAARRTSEGTKAAAQNANKGGYQPISRRRLIWKPTTTSPAARPGLAPPPPPPPVPFARQSFPSPPPARHASQPPPARHASPPLPLPAQAPSIRSQTRGLSSQDTKAEQARLLTLLRSLHPLLVVDQLCKALAYFGGIPGAPPPSPSDGDFPQSATVNGSGSLFVSWLAEIFPAVDGLLHQGAATPPPGHPALGPSESSVNSMAFTVRRKRGRPKGSKSTKARKDKGIKKGPKIGSAPDSGDPTTAATESELTTEPQIQTAIDLVEETPSSSQAVPGLSTPAQQVAGQPGPESSVTGTPGSKRRGRPKGSKNRPKDSSEQQSSRPPLEPVSPISTRTANTASVQNAAPEQTKSAATQHQSRPGSEAQRPKPTGAQSSVAENSDDVQQLDSLQHAESQTQPANAQATGSMQKDVSRKRKALQTESSAAVAIGSRAARQVTETPVPLPTIHNSTFKRRRMSKESSRTAVSSAADSQPPGGLVASPVATNNPLQSDGPSRSTSSSFDSQASRSRQPTPRTNSTQWTPQQQQQHLRQSQQQMHQRQQWHQQHQSPNMASAGQQRQAGSMQMGGTPAMHGSMAGAFPLQQMNRAAQGYLTQRQQLSHQYGQGMSAGDVQHNTGAMTSQFQQHMARQGQQRSPARLSSRQTPATSAAAPAAGMDQFQGFGDRDYMGVDYGLDTARGGMHNQTAAFADQTQLEAALAEPDIRQRLYQAIGRR